MGSGSDCAGDAKVHKAIDNEERPTSKQQHRLAAPGGRVAALAWPYPSTSSEVTASVASHPRRCGIPAMRIPAMRNHRKLRVAVATSTGTAATAVEDRRAEGAWSPDRSAPFSLQRGAGPKENRRAIKGDRAGPCCFAKKRYGFDDWPTGPGAMEVDAKRKLPADAARTSSRPVAFIRVKSAPR